MKPARPKGIGAAATGVAFGAIWFFRLAPQCGHQGGIRPSGLAKTCFEQLPQLLADAMIGTRKRLIIGALPNSSSWVIDSPGSEMAAGGFAALSSAPTWGRERFVSFGRAQNVGQ